LEHATACLMLCLERASVRYSARNFFSSARPDR
jgi:hypothetical protein